MTEPSSYELGSSKFHASALVDWLNLVSQSSDMESRVLVTSMNIHALYVRRQERDLDFLLDDDFPARVYNRVDGMPILLALKLAGHRVSRNQRVTWVDFLPALWNLASRHGWKIAYVGSDANALELGARRLNAEQGTVEFLGIPGFFDVDSVEDNNRVIEALSQFEPRVLLIGMGMPRQEKWIVSHWNRLNAPCVLTVGAAIGYYGGLEQVAPRWMGRFSMEWIFRLLQDPRRLWKRYSVEPLTILPRLIAHALAQKISQRKHNAQKTS